MYGCESWTVKKDKCRRIDAFEMWCWRWLESPLDCKEFQSVNPTGNQPWIFIGRADAEAPILWPPDVKSPLIGKDPDAGKGWRQEEKGTTEGEMVGWHHWLNGHESEWTLGVGDDQGGLMCCSPWGHKELDTTERLNWTEYPQVYRPGKSLDFPGQSGLCAVFSGMRISELKGDASHGKFIKWSCVSAASICIEDPEAGVPSTSFLTAGPVHIPQFTSSHLVTHEEGGIERGVRHAHAPCLLWQSLCTFPS